MKKVKQILKSFLYTLKDGIMLKHFTSSFCVYLILIIITGKIQDIFHDIITYYIVWILIGILTLFTLYSIYHMIKNTIKELFT